MKKIGVFILFGIGIVCLVIALIILLKPKKTRTYEFAVEILGTSFHVCLKKPCSENLGIVVRGKQKFISPLPKTLGVSVYKNISPVIIKSNVSPAFIITFTPTPEIEATPTSSPTLIPTSTPVPEPTATPTAVPTPSPVPTQISPEQFDKWFTDYSNNYSIDRTTLVKICVCESALNPNAVNGDYGGLFQFTDNTWRSTRNEMNLDPNPDLRFNAEEAIKTAAFKISVDGTNPWKNCAK